MEAEEKRFTCKICKFRGQKDECLRPSFEIPCYYGSPLKGVPEIYIKHRQAPNCR
jgi:hypothetical protein